MTFNEDRQFMNECIQAARKAIEDEANKQSIDLIFYQFTIKASRLDAQDYKTPLITITDEEPRAWVDEK